MEESDRVSVRILTRVSLFAACMGVCAWISIPVGDMAFTMQTFGVFLALAVLGGKWGTLSILVYLLLGGMGLPVFHGLQGGLGMLLGATGGYLWGFLLSGLTYWLLERLGKIPAMAAGLLVCYACGSMWFLCWSGGGLLLVLVRCVLPYLLPDGLKLALAYSVSRRLPREI